MPTDSSSLSRRLRLLGLCGGVAAVILVGWGVYARARDVGEVQAWTDARAIPMVKLVQPKPAAGDQPLELPGALQAYNDAQIYARVPGYLKAWNVDIGAHVKQGQVLAVIDAPELDQQLAEAKANLATAQANLGLAKVTAGRFEGLADDDAVSRQDADEKSEDLAAKTAVVQAAQANVQRLQALAGFKQITAPFDGVVTQRSANIGALVNAGSSTATALFNVADVRRLRVYIRLPQSYSASIRPGLQAALVLPQYPNRTFAAQVVSDAGAVSDQSGTLLVELQVGNDDGALKPGDYAQVRLGVPGVGGVRVPASALVFRRNGLQVATVGVDNHARLKSVSVSRDLGSEVELSGGVSAHDRLIDNPPDSLEDGDLVRTAAAAAGNGHAA